MNTFSPKPNSGALFPNSYKKQQNHPDVKGDIYVDRSLLKSLMSKTDEDLIKLSLSGWIKVSSRGDFTSLSISEPYERKEQKPVADEDVPF